jgi:isoquinoline 1-oxidoreductase subunit beta
MLIAEELEVDLKRVWVVAAPVDAAYNHPRAGMQFSGSSTSVASEWERLRKAGATAREMLLAAAAETWQMDRASLRAENGRVIDPGGRSLTYGQLVNKARTMSVPQDVPLEDPSQWKIIGKPTLRLDSREKVTGAAQFGLDARVPDMLTALVARPPLFGGKVRHVDAAKAQAVRGVKRVVEIPSGVAVVADSFDGARRRHHLRGRRDPGERSRLVLQDPVVHQQPDAQQLLHDQAARGERRRDDDADSVGRPRHRRSYSTRRQCRVFRCGSARPEPAGSSR